MKIFPAGKVPKAGATFDYDVQRLMALRLRGQRLTDPPETVIGEMLEAPSYFNDGVITFQTLEGKTRKFDATKVEDAWYVELVREEV